MLPFLPQASHARFFRYSDTIIVTTGAYGDHPSFKGSISSLSYGCHNYSGESETKLSGVWYFDENSFPRDNIFNPRHTGPKIDQHVDAASWDPAIKRWKVFNGSKIVLQVGHFLDFRPTELHRGITVVVDFKLLAPPSGSIASLPDPVQVAILSSDIKFAFGLKYDTGASKYKAYPQTLNPSDNWVSLPGVEFSFDFTSDDIVHYLTVTRSLTDPSYVTIDMSPIVVTSGLAFYGDWANTLTKSELLIRYFA